MDLNYWGFKNFDHKQPVHVVSYKIAKSAGII